VLWFVKLVYGVMRSLAFYAFFLLCVFFLPLLWLFCRCIYQERALATKGVNVDDSLCWAGLDTIFFGQFWTLKKTINKKNQIIKDKD